MQATEGARGFSNAIPVPQALEFFVFGKAVHEPVRNSSCDPEMPYMLET